MKLNKILEGELPEGSVSIEKAKELSRKVGAENFDIKEFRRGVEVEMEHSDTVGDGLEMAAKIALDHLKEDPKYYTKLAKIE